MSGGATPTAIDSVVHIIQVSLTPVFLLTGIATLLNVFSTRLARVADQVEALMKATETAGPQQLALLSLQLANLHRRSLALDGAVVLGATAGASTCASVLGLFVGETGGLAVAAVLYVTFGLAIACILAAIIAYAAEMMMAGSRVRAEVATGRQMAKPE
jgi:Protein of unknown function (DUF2721)